MDSHTVKNKSDLGPEHPGLPRSFHYYLYSGPVDIGPVRAIFLSIPSIAIQIVHGFQPCEYKVVICSESGYTLGMWILIQIYA